MTLVRLFFTAPTTGGRVPAKGVLRWTPTRRRVISGETDEVVLPSGFDVEVSEFSQVPVDASGVDWVWRVDEKLGGVRSRTVYLVVPDVDSIDYSDLVEIDPDTLDPIAPPSEVWYAHVEALALTAASAKDAAEIAQAATEEAAATIVPERTLAQTARSEAQQAASASAVSAGASASSASNASNSATTAATRASEAQGSEVAAQGYASSALSSKNASENARDLAVSARGGAEAAQGVAETYANTAEANANGFDIGTVVTKLPTEPAAARIVGVAPNRELELDIPMGKTPVITIGTVTTGLPQANPGTPGTPGGQGIQGPPGDMVTVTGPTNVTGTIPILTADLPKTPNWTLIGNITITLPTPTNARSGTITLIMTQDATGGRTVTWPANTVLKWPDGIAQQPAPAANSVSVIHLLWTGYIWLGLLGGKSFA